VRHPQPPAFSPLLQPPRLPIGVLLHHHHRAVKVDQEGPATEVAKEGPPVLGREAGRANLDAAVEIPWKMR
jgi:hypothetical protein